MTWSTELLLAAEDLSGVVNATVAALVHNAVTIVATYMVIGLSPDGKICNDNPAQSVAPANCIAAANTCATVYHLHKFLRSLDTSDTMFLLLTWFHRVTKTAIIHPRTRSVEPLPPISPALMN